MRKRILIVEDNPFIALDLQDIFEEAGFTVIGPAATVHSAMGLVKKTSIDVAMLDFNLGHETSLPLAKALEDLDIPYAFLSGQIDKVVTQAFSRPRTVIAKPFDTQYLLSHVNPLLH